MKRVVPSRDLTAMTREIRRGLERARGNLPDLSRFMGGDAGGEILSLPIFPHMSDWQVSVMCETMRDALGERELLLG